MAGTPPQQRSPGPNPWGLRYVGYARGNFRAGRYAPYDVGNIAAAEGAASVGDHPLAAVAARQHSLLIAGQLRALGVTARATTDRVRRGLLFRVERGVYAVGSPALTGRGVLLAAVLACGPRALLTAGAALEIWGVAVPEAKPPDVLTPQKRRPRSTVRPHRTSTLHPTDHCALDHIPLAAPARSLLDHATAAGPNAVESALDGLRALRLLRSEALDDLRTRTNGHHGWGPLNAVLLSRTEPGFSRSRAETLTRDLIRAAGLPAPMLNARAAGYEADLYWPDLRVAVEFDSWRHHSGRDPFEGDRAKSTEMQATGITVIRLTWAQLTKRPEWVVARLAVILASRGLYFRKPS